LTVINPSNLTLADYAVQLATVHQSFTKLSGKGSSLLRQMAADLRTLNRIGHMYQIDLKSEITLPPAGEWLVDNLYLINEQAQFILCNFPAAYHRTLPVLSAGPQQNQRRIYALLRSLVEYCDGRCTTALLTEFLQAYQKTLPLTMGELWAVPLMLRVAIINKLAQIFTEVEAFTLPKQQADVWLNEINPLLRGMKDSIQAVQAVVQTAERHLDLANPKVIVHLARQIRNQINYAPLLRWLEARSTAQNLSLGALIQDEQAQQAQYRVSAGDLISSLRELARTNWNRYFEELSLVEAVLQLDPAGVYPLMDFESRDRMRHTLEALARRMRRTEIDLAEEIVAIAAGAASSDSLERHVGFYLMAGGRRHLCKAIGLHCPVWCYRREVMTIFPNLFYFGGLFGLMLLFYVAMGHFLYGLKLFTPLQLTLLMLVMLVPAAEWAERQLHWLLTAMFPPQRLPKLQFKQGIPSEATTMIVIPTIISSLEGVMELLHRMEVYHLANFDPHIYFALLTDFTDAPQEHMPQDEAILDAARLGLQDLNTHYPHPEPGNQYFYLLHRSRLWNPSEAVWMGWERKRGKLQEFNALVNGDDGTSFAVIEGPQTTLSQVRYVITLDSDTQLPREAAFKLIGTIAHPLNSPVLNEERTKVVSGYGILQPRIAISHASAQRSRFAFLFSGRCGIDVYSGAISDPYQDLFQSGIYTGKGIYDVRIFHHLLKDRIPANSVLSHDLLEGGFLRAGLLSDVELIDDFPSTYLASLSRTHRWVRGDWQLLPWFIPRPRDQHGNRRPARLPLITRWQILSNLLRSLLGPIFFGLFWLAILILPGHPVILPLPLLIMAGISFLTYLVSLTNGIKQGYKAHQWLGRLAFGILILPYHSLSVCDAILRTLYRIFISRRRLLQWVTFDDERRRSPNHFGAIWSKMLSGQLLVVALLFLSELVQPGSGKILIVLVLCWLTAPLWIFWMGRPLPRHQFFLSNSERHYLRRIARRTWYFFDTIITEADHWLPPDNLQVDPDNGLAHRTSPTNIGLALAATVVARDFGYLTTSGMLCRIEQTLNILEELPRWKGHFYNWYDTQTLQPLQPLYISTVDSGNLAAYLLVVKESIADWLERPCFDPQSTRGLVDAARLEADSHPSAVILADQLRRMADSKPTLIEWYAQLKKLNGDPVLSPEVSRTIQDQLDEYDTLFPWLWLLAGNKAAENAVRCIESPETSTAGECHASNLVEGLLRISRLTEIVSFHQFWTKSIAPKNAVPDEWPEAELREMLGRAATAAQELISAANSLMDRLERLISAPDFAALYDEDHRLFSIGYNVSHKQMDPSFYDLLASEARQASFMAIALGQVPAEHWFALGRTLTRAGLHSVLLSWGGSMFEYLMPLLLMPNYPNTLMDETYQVVVERQAAYGRHLHIPWGVSESAFHIFDFKLNYQYQSFGTPGLGLKQGLENDRVVAPYASLMALMVDPGAVVSNLKHLERYGTLAEYGFYEAVDFTPSRLPEKSRHALVKSYMAHHQGMAFLALGNQLLDNRLQQRFLTDPRIQATETLLREKIPTRAVILSQKAPQLISTRIIHDEGADLRSFRTLKTPLPEARFLGNGRYLTMVSNSGGGFSQWQGLALTRWIEDPVRDAAGSFFYIRNLNDNTLWSPTYQPCRIEADDASMSFSLEKIAFSRNDGPIHTFLEICVSPELDAEIRRITLSNHGDEPCTLEVTSAVEPVLAKPADYKAHPAFSRLFIETEAVRQVEGLLAHRRSGGNGAAENPWLIHAVHTDGPVFGRLEFETDRARFVGRGRSASLPQVIMTRQPLSGTTGTVLEPILCLRKRVRIDPGERVHISFITGVAASRTEAIDIAARLRSEIQINRTFDLAWTFSRIELRHLNLQPNQANLFQWMGSALFYFNPYRSGRAELALRNTKDQSGLWPYQISGDLPILLVRVSEIEDLDVVKTMINAHEYWRLKGLQSDLVILNDFQGGYEQPLQEAIINLIENSSERENLDHLGGVYLRSGILMPEEDRTLMEVVARLVVRGGHKHTLIQQLKSEPEEYQLPALRPIQLPDPSVTVPQRSGPPEHLLFFNGLGGFTGDGREYLIHLKGRELPPLPWINVIANPRFGTHLSETGSGCTWAANSREFRITPWFNDPILDPMGEFCYLRDEESGLLWSLTAQPIRESHPYLIRHGQGYTTFWHFSQGIEQTALVFVPPDDPVKLVRITLRNIGKEPRRLTLTYYLEWVLGVNRESSAPYIATEIDSVSGALCARNLYQHHFRNQVSFLHLWCDGPELERSWTGDRAEFIGRNGSMARPAALERESLSNRTGAGFYPCGAIQVKLEIAPESERDIYVLVGSTDPADRAALIERYREPSQIAAAYQETVAGWDQILGKVQIHTPNEAFDVMLNRWLLYQTLSCRLWARTAGYQSGGAYGFRDQLQDALSLLHSAPEITRSQILRHAAHQFREGDVQHWWHEETGVGIRTRFRDDRLWLVYATCRYTEHTGDDLLWKEKIPFLESEPLHDGETERYEPTVVAAEKATLYEHCRRAIDTSLQFGEHGLPLIGGGDWNDGMNRLGIGGKGESVWLGWFLYTILEAFTPICSGQEDLKLTEVYRQKAEELKTALNDAGWDGEWYRRAYNDDGEPLGSLRNAECQIDCIAQAWAVISGAAPEKKALQAMNALQEKLVVEEDALVRLLAPPFENTEPSPGYIQAYPPGVRENGAQYTHAAAWAVIAWAMLGEGDRAYELFRMLNPIYHARTSGEVQRYKVEPYVMAADVYSMPPHNGRGGWTWYTGSAGWMYQAGLEWILGVRRRGDHLLLQPCIPAEWEHYTVEYHYGASLYSIVVKNPSGRQTGLSKLTLDGKKLDAKSGLIPLKDDGKPHRVEAEL
jgi:cyclic beta-1,2-glucan synthetase